MTTELATELATDPTTDTAAVGPRPAGLTATAIPLACVPGAIPPAERQAHVALAARLLAESVRERRALTGGEDGYAYRFDADAFDDLARWIANERRCCPFLTFTLELAPGGGPVWARLAGPAGTRELLDAELPAPAR
jgi:hypothetical protein